MVLLGLHLAGSCALRDIVQNLSNAPCVRVGEINCGGHGLARINDPALLRFWTDFRKRLESLRHRIRKSCRCLYFKGMHLPLALNDQVNLNRPGLIAVEIGVRLLAPIESPLHLLCDNKILKEIPPQRMRRD